MTNETEPRWRQALNGMIADKKTAFFIGLTFGIFAGVLI